MQVGNIVQEKISPLRKKTINNASAGFVVEEEANEVESKEVSPAKVNISALWTLQEVDSYDADVGKMKQVCNELIKRLNNIRMDLISGEFTRENITSLREALAKSKIKLQFPDLQDVMDDIELRAEVELAKLEMIG